VDRDTPKNYQLLNVTDVDSEERVFIGNNMWHDGSKWVLPGNAREVSVSWDNVLLNNIHLTRK
jgi:hypothetical protein